MSFKQLLPLVFGFCWLTGCHSRQETRFRPENVKTQLPEQQNRIISDLVFNYLSLKNALVAEQSAAADSIAGLLQRNLAAIQTAIASDSIRNTRLSICLDSMQLQTVQILRHPGKDCEPQRIYFKYLSDQVLTLLRETRASGLGLYSQYCPMALNETGGWWLSTSAEIENPYFGKK